MPVHRKITRATPGISQTKAITRGVAPVIQAQLQALKVKQYLKQGSALPTETTVNDPYDFGVARLLTHENWRAPLGIDEHTNQRLLDAQLGACDCAPNPTALARIVPPPIHDGLPTPSLGFGDPRVRLLLACLCHYGHLFNALTNRSLREVDRRPDRRLQHKPGHL